MIFKFKNIFKVKLWKTNYGINWKLWTEKGNPSKCGYQTQIYKKSCVDQEF